MGMCETGRGAGESGTGRPAWGRYSAPPARVRSPGEHRLPGESRPRVADHKDDLDRFLTAREIQRRDGAPPEVTLPEAPKLVGVGLRDEPFLWRLPDPPDGTPEELRHVDVLAERKSVEEDRHRLVVIRRTERPGGPDATIGLVARFQEAAANASSKELIDGTPAWDIATAPWQTQEATSLADVAEMVGHLKSSIHETFVGAPTRTLLTSWGLQPLPSELVGATAAAYALPGDGAVRQVKLLVQVTGLIAGAAAGNPLLVSACLKSWVHDQVRDAVARKFVELLHDEPFK